MGAKKGELVDHRDHDTLRNLKSNLRICTHSQNQWNRKAQKNCFSKFKGVSYNKLAKKYIARIKVNNKSIHLSYFNTELEAAEAYNTASLKYHGEFGYLNKFNKKEKENE